MARRKKKDKVQPDPQTEQKAKDVRIEDEEEDQEKLAMGFGEGESFLPIFKPDVETPEMLRERMMQDYMGDPDKILRERIFKGSLTIKERARKSKYLHKVLDQKLKKHVDSSMWKESTVVLTKLQRVETAKSKLRKARDSLLVAAEKQILEEENERIIKEKIRAREVHKRLTFRRKVKLLLSGILLTAAFAIFLLIPVLELSISQTFRYSIASTVQLNDPSGWISCDAVFGATIDFSSTSVARTCVENLTQVEYYLHNITNPDAIKLSSAIPAIENIGPFKFNIGVKKRLKSATNRWVTIERQPYYEYVGDESLLDKKVTTLNKGFLQAVAHLETHYQVEDEETVLLTWLAMDAFKENILNAGISTVEQWLEEKDGGVDCATFGCFLFSKKFTVIAAQATSVEDIDNLISGNLERLPVFGHDPLSLDQASTIWNMLQEGTGFVKLASSQDEECMFKSQELCDKLGKPASNLHILVSSFRVLWMLTKSSSTIVNSIDAVRMAKGKILKDLSEYYLGLWSRDFRCETATGFVGNLRCTQLNDLVQYFYWLFKKNWSKLFTLRKSEKDLFAYRTAREHLLTGFEDSFLMLLNLEPSSAKAIDSTPLDRLPVDGIITDPTQAEWMRYGWVAPILDMPPKHLVASFLPENEQPTDVIYRFPGTYIQDQSPSKVSSVEYIPQNRGYMVGVEPPQKLGGAQFMGLINGEISAKVFGDVSTLQGYDGMQLGPSLDIFRVGQRYDRDYLPYSTDQGLNSWKVSFDFWLDLPYRSSLFVLQEGQTAAFQTLEGQENHKNVDMGLTSIDTGTHIDLPLQEYRLQNDRLSRYATDQVTGTTCMVSIAPISNDVRIYIGFPNYWACNSSGGNTPVSRAVDVNTNYDNTGLSDAKVLSEEEKKAEESKEEPLPLNERASMTSTGLPASDTKILVDPVTGHIFQAFIRLGAYIDMLPTSMLFPYLEKIKVPYYATYTSYSRTAKDAQELESTLFAMVLGIHAMRWTLNVTMVCCVAVGVIMLTTSLRRPELNYAQVTPVDKLEEKAKVLRDEMLIPLRDDVKSKKEIYDSALAEYEATKEQTINHHKSRGAELLFAPTPEDPSASWKVKKKAPQSTALNEVYGITRSGSIFKFSNEELAIVVNKEQNKS